MIDSAFLLVNKLQLLEVWILPNKKKNVRYLKRKKKRYGFYNIGTFIFFLIFLYMVYSLYTYITKDRIEIYQVMKGSIVNEQNYEGVILREEHVQATQQGGYINLYVQEGKRASLGMPVYSIDQDRDVSAGMGEGTDKDSTLNEEDLEEIKRDISEFSQDFEAIKFSEIYNFQYSVESSIVKAINFNSMGNLDLAIANSNGAMMQYAAPFAGVVSYTIDGYEGKVPTDLIASDFNMENYEKKIVTIGQLAESGSGIYKLVTSDVWQIVFQLPEGESNLFEENQKVQIVLKPLDLEVTGTFTSAIGTDGTSLGVIEVDRYLVEILSQRFVDFEIVQKDKDGLKVPISAVIEKEFYVIPKSYLMTVGEDTNGGFNKLYFENEGERAQYEPAEIYHESEEYYYIIKEEGGTFQAGDYIQKPESDERYQIGETRTLPGVYNVNKGYTMFKLIETISSSDEFYTVQIGSSYGLSEFDHIVLNGKTVSEGELIFQ